MRALALALIALAGISATRADDAVTIHQRLDFYTVRGLTVEAIGRSLLRDAPRDLDGFQGQTTFWFDWDFDTPPLASDPKRCRVTDARVDIDIVITLPRHRSIGRAPAELRQAWATFIAAMDAHERHHAVDFIAIGRQLPAGIEGLVAPCATIEDVANARGMDFVNEAQKAADDYDAETNHGGEQGTIWPGL